MKQTDFSISRPQEHEHQRWDWDETEYGYTQHLKRVFHHPKYSEENSIVSSQLHFHSRSTSPICVACLNREVGYWASFWANPADSGRDFIFASSKFSSRVSTRCAPHSNIVMAFQTYSTQSTVEAPMYWRHLECPKPQPQRSREVNRGLSRSSSALRAPVHLPQQRLGFDSVQLPGQGLGFDCSGLSSEVVIWRRFYLPYSIFGAPEDAFYLGTVTTCTHYRETETQHRTRLSWTNDRMARKRHEKPHRVTFEWKAIILRYEKTNETIK